jgi:hypothetical protein
MLAQLSHRFCVGLRILTTSRHRSDRVGKLTSSPSIDLATTQQDGGRLPMSLGFEKRCDAVRTKNRITQFDKSRWVTRRVGGRAHPSVSAAIGSHGLVVRIAADRLRTIRLAAFAG